MTEVGGGWEAGEEMGRKKRVWEILSGVCGGVERGSIRGFLWGEF